MTITKSRSFKMQSRGVRRTRTLPNAWSNYSTDTSAVFSQDGGITSVRDDNLADWKGKIDRHESATTNLQVTGQVLDPGEASYFLTSRLSKVSGNWKLTDQIEAGGNYGGRNVSKVMPTMSTSNVANLALIDFLSKCYSAQRTFSGGVFLGELRETINWLRHPGSAIKKALTDHLKRVRRMRAPPNKRLPVVSRRRMAANAIAGSWLELQFAVKPLEADIEDAITAVYELVNRVVPSENIRSRQFKESQTTSVSTTTTGSAGYGILSRTYRISQGASAYMYGQVTLDNGLRGAPRRLGLSFQDIVPVLWEVTPWSFVVDYFSNIGDILEALTFNSASVKWANVGCRQIAENRLISSDFVLTTATSSFRYELNQLTLPRGWKQSSFTLARSKYEGSFIPVLQVEIPGLTSRKWLNLTALLGQKDAAQKSINRNFRL